MSGFDHRKYSWVANARVVDIAAFNRLKAEGLGGRKIGQGLGIPVSQAQRLLDGQHWQQDAGKVRVFNEHRGATLDIATGQPAAEDLKQFGGPYMRLTRHSKPGEREAKDLLRGTGIPGRSLDEALRRLQVLGGNELDIPARVDAKYLQDAIDGKLARALVLLDDVAMSAASPADLARIIDMLVKNRALLRGEPTQIVRSEHRAKLEDLVAMALAEARRRGVKAPEVLEGSYQEVGGA